MSAAFGVNVIGQLRAESGIGEAARSVVAALDAAGVPVIPALPPGGTPSREEVPFPVAPIEQARFPVTLSLLTAYETGPFLEAAPSHTREGRVIGLWWWEIEAFPDFMAAAFPLVDAVWAGTEHVRGALAAASDGTPVELVRYPVRRPRPSGAGRQELGLPTEGVLVVTSFGFFSSVERKNPAGAIEAFLRAFPQAQAGGPQLVIKTIDEDAHGGELAALAALAAPHSHVHLLPGYLDRQGMDDLLAAADIVLSLHRAEGFGYTPAEAMALGRPVIATGYSGNLEYMTAENAVLIDAPLRPIGERGGPYPPDGQWGEPDIDQAAVALRRLVFDPAARQRLGVRAAVDLAEQFSVQRAGASMAQALERLPGEVPRVGPWRARRLRRIAAELRAAR